MAIGIGFGVIASSAVPDVLTIISGNTEFVFESAVTRETSIELLTANVALVVYADSGNSGFGTAQILDISGGIITGNTPFVFSSSNTDKTSLQIIDSSTAIVTYVDGGSSTAGTAQILDISGTTVAGNTAFVYESSDTDVTHVDVIDSSTAIVGYGDQGAGRTRAQILDISGGVGSRVIAGNSSFDVHGSSSNEIKVQIITSAKALIVYNAATANGVTQILDISSGTITGNTPFTFNAANSSFMDMKLIDSSTALVVYNDAGNSNNETAQILDIGATTVTGNSEFVFNAATTNDHLALRIIDDETAIVSYEDNGNSLFGTAQILTIDGGTVTGNNEFVFNSASTDHISIALVNDITAIVAYRDIGNSQFGTSQILNIS